MMEQRINYCLGVVSLLTHARQKAATVKIQKCHDIENGYLQETILKVMVNTGK